MVYRHLEMPLQPALIEADAGASAALGHPDFKEGVAAFRERRIELASVPGAFLRRLAGALAASFDDFVAWMTPPPANALARSYRADGQPNAPAQVSFERILIDAGVSEADRAILLSDEN